MGGREEEEGSRGGAHDTQFIGRCLSVGPRPCTRTVASLLLLAQAHAVTLTDSFMAAGAIAPSLVKQSFTFSPWPISRRVEPWCHLGALRKTSLFRGHLAALPHTDSCAAKQGNTSRSWAPTIISSVSSPTETIATGICEALLGTCSGVTGVPLSHGEVALAAWQRGGTMCPSTRTNATSLGFVLQLHRRMSV